MITSNQAREDYNYKLSMIYINKIKNKTNFSFGSVQLGIKYANFYFKKIEEMLISEYINYSILEELKIKVNQDYEIIIKDCNFRVYNEHVLDNKYLISVILDFILSL
jgi:cellulose biosynthesis protein BcsQ